MRLVGRLYAWEGKLCAWLVDYTPGKVSYALGW
jgi:hypothetical protein